MSDKSLLWTVFRILRTFVITLFARIIVRAEDLKAALGIIRSSFAGLGLEFITPARISTYGLEIYNILLLVLCVAFLIVIEIIQQKTCVRDHLMKRNYLIRWVIIYVSILFIVIFGIYGPGYNAVDFIYGNF